MKTVTAEIVANEIGWRGEPAEWIYESVRRFMAPYWR